ncbi:PapB/FocB family fimbrial expression transcriptional regulator [Pseudomonas sp. W22_MBD1_FP4]|uniref:PapB/FocB family fimbrial expression transcriptional regulator n=1 Tax=Pseudomonas sp. W22_MBD1_FP4 TaxID=3240272 RepID=UPI003F9575BF
MAAGTRELVPGQVDPEHLRRLIGLTKITAESVISALNSHFVLGTKQSVACAEFGISNTTLSRKVSDLNRLSLEVREIAKFYR